jgi:predicted TIM-barrel fold metal-dependent hydrolase
MTVPQSALAGPAPATGASRRVIVDAQVHLWKASGPDYPWNPGAKPQLPEPFTVERVVPLMDEAGVDRVVIVPPALNEVNSYALEAVRRYPGRFAVMGRIPLQDPKSAALLPGWKNQPGMLGVRLTFNTPETLAWLSDGTADWFWPAAEKNRLPVMFLAFGNVHRFGPIAQRHPELPLIIDHLGVNTAIAKEGKDGGEDRRRCGARQVPQRQHQDVEPRQRVAGALSVPRPERPSEAGVRRLRPAALLLGDRSDQHLLHPRDLAPAHHPFHRGALVPVRKRQGLGDGSVHP